VFVTSTARTLDIGTVLVNESNALVITSPEMKQQLLQRFDKYIFPADKVDVSVLAMAVFVCDNYIFPADKVDVSVARALLADEYVCVMFVFVALWVLNSQTSTPVGLTTAVMYDCELDSFPAKITVYSRFWPHLGTGK
jgi:hypothetical protein